MHINLCRKTQLKNASKKFKRKTFHGNTYVRVNGGIVSLRILVQDNGISYLLYVCI